MVLRISASCGNCGKGRVRDEESLRWWQATAWNAANDAAGQRLWAHGAARIRNPGGGRRSFRLVKCSYKINSQKESYKKNPTYPLLVTCNHFLIGIVGFSPSTVDRRPSICILPVAQCPVSVHTYRCALLATHVADLLPSHRGSLVPLIPRGVGSKSLNPLIIAKLQNLRYFPTGYPPPQSKGDVLQAPNMNVECVVSE